MALAFTLTTWLQWPLIYVLLSLGTATCVGTYVLLRRRASAESKAS